MYQFNINGNTIVRLSDGAIIPVAPGNADYEEYMEWVNAGGITIRAESPDPQAVIQMQLDQLEQATQMNRLTREFMLVSMQDMAQRQSELLDANGITMSPLDILNARPGWLKLVEVNNQASALREAMA